MGRKGEAVGEGRGGDVEHFDPFVHLDFGILDALLG